MIRIPRTPESIPFPAPPDSVIRKTMYLGSRQIPEIGGSKGAFIGVVVALSVVIVVCCAAVFYLLRHHEPTDQERTARRERFRRTREQTLNSSSIISQQPTFGSGSLGDKVKQAWRSTAGRVRGGGRRGGPGWIRAGSDDEWASHSDHEGRVSPNTRADAALRSLPVLERDAPHSGTVAGAEGVRVVESPLSDSASGFGPGQYAYAYADPFSKTLSDTALQRSQSPLSLSSPVPSPREEASVDESHEAHSPACGDRRHCSAMSNGSVWTQAGSKFVEDI